jgi:hypothetical protein
MEFDSQCEEIMAADTSDEEGGEDDEDGGKSNPDVPTSSSSSSTTTTTRDETVIIHGKVLVNFDDDDDDEEGEDSDSGEGESKGLSSDQVLMALLAKEVDDDHDDVRGGEEEEEEEGINRRRGGGGAGSGCEKEDVNRMQCHFILDSPLHTKVGIEKTTWRFLMAHVISTLAPPHSLFFNSDNMFNDYMNERYIEQLNFVNSDDGVVVGGGGGSGGKSENKKFESEIELWNDTLLLKGLVLGHSNIFVTNDSYDSNRVRADIMIRLIENKFLVIKVKVYNICYSIITKKLFDKVKACVLSFLNEQRMIHVTQSN